MNNMATGFVEVYGFTTAICSADAAAKAADVKIVAIDSNKPANAETAEVPLVMCIKMEGSVSAVEAGVAAAIAKAKSKAGVLTSHIIPRPTDDTVKLVKRCSVGRDKIKKD